MTRTEYRQVIIRHRQKVERIAERERRERREDKLKSLGVAAAMVAIYSLAHFMGV